MSLGHSERTVSMLFFNSFLNVSPDLRNCLGHTALQSRVEVWRERECCYKSVCAKYWSIFAKLSSALRNASPGPAQPGSSSELWPSSPNQSSPPRTRAAAGCWLAAVVVQDTNFHPLHWPLAPLAPLTRGHGLEVTTSPPPPHHQQGANCGGEGDNGDDDEGTVLLCDCCWENAPSALTRWWW